MGKISKNLIVAFAVLCAIVLIVFCVELIALNRTGGDGGAAASMSGGPGEGETNDADGQRTPPDTNNPGGAGPAGSNSQSGNTNTPTGPAAPPAGTRFPLLMPGDMVLTIYADEDKFKYTELDLAWLYEYKGNSTASLLICLDYMPRGVEEFAKNYLDGYVGNGGTSVDGEDPIGRSSLNGVFVSGEKDGENYEAWIYNFPAKDINDMGVLFVLHYRSDEQKNALYTLLDTLELTHS